MLLLSASETHKPRTFSTSKLMDHILNKRQDDKWIWRYVNTNGSENGQTASATTARTTEAVIYRNDNTSTSTPTTSIPTTTETTSPCSPFIPPKRDFNAPGRRGAIGWKATIGTWIFKCGSTLISEKFVLTAGHCSSASIRDTTIADPIPKIVRLGDKNIIDTGFYGQQPQDENIIRIITHPQYSAPKKYFDIALMELENAVSYSRYVQPACLWNKFDVSKLGSQATLTGWGVTETVEGTTSPEVQAAVVDIIDSQQCDKLLRDSCNRHWCGVQEHQICAGKLAGGVDACQGDSGGPLQVKSPLPSSTEGTVHYVIGVTSFGIECALPNLPGVYTRVSSFIDWIEDIVWKN